MKSALFVFGYLISGFVVEYMIMYISKNKENKTSNILEFAVICLWPLILGFSIVVGIAYTLAYIAKCVAKKISEAITFVVELAQEINEASERED